MATAAAKLVADGVRPSEIAVLFRTNAQSEPLEQALAEAGVPYVLRGGERFFARREVREAIVLLRGAARAGDPALPLGEATREALSAAGWSLEPPSGTGAVRERWESLQALVALADELERGPARLHPERPGRRARRAGGGPARADRRGRHAGLAARGQGPGVGRRLPGRAQRGAAADQLRRGGDRGRGGAPAALRRRDPGPRAPAPVLVAVPHAGRPGQPQAVALPGRAPAGRPGHRRAGRSRRSHNGFRLEARQGQGHGDDLPHLRPGA